MLKLSRTAPWEVRQAPCLRERFPDGDHHLSHSGLPGQAGRTESFPQFSAFNVGTGESATFTGPGGIQNILSA